MRHEDATHTLIFLVYLLLFVSARCEVTQRLIEYNVDGGKEDLFDVNEDAGLDLFEGDILYDETLGRNSIIGEEYRWPKTIPYYFEDDLEINAKGVILKAFEQYRLKTCIDYKPWTGEENYISVFKGNGCFSSVGNRRVGRQTLSIGSGCDRIATIEHEFLHALGFWHEQSRSDRDDYVSIMWDRITEGKEHNFNKYNDSSSSALNVPYDYSSMMHYSQKAFQSGSEPTIITRIPAFSSVIGQRMEFSDSDLLKLNRLYNCTSSSTFLDSCDFELENICGMIQKGEADSTAEWRRVPEAAGGPDTDYTNMGRCEGKGYFMHFSTAGGPEGAKALLESRVLYPKRGFQCLQFFVFNSGHTSDRLRIWTREFDTENPNGTLRLVQQIHAPPGERWQLQHISLNVSRKFRVVFEGTKGTGSSGGLSIDDINLSETRCPDHVWIVRDFKSILENTPMDTAIYSPRFTSRLGYSFQMGLYPNGTAGNPGEMGAYAHLVSGDAAVDGGLVWPAQWKQMTMMMMDQNADIRRRMSNQRSVTTDPNMTVEGSLNLFWDDPRKVGVKVTDDNGTEYFRGPGAGTPVYLTQARALSRDFIKGGDAIFLLTMEDISDLVASQPLPSTTVTPATSAHTGPTNPDNSTTASPATHTSSITHTSADTHTSSSTTSSSSSTTVPPPDPCVSLQCENDGVCVQDDAGQPVCRCAVGSDWWYYGERCQHKSSTRHTVVTAVLAAGLTLLLMLAITAVSVVCVKKRRKTVKLDTHDITMHNIHSKA
ncbi:meprin A subunit beta isoform X2 [Danio rerio]|uniref:Meprin A subunit n=1 Tax=Danio rerio TaxID=7955 RepID=A0A8M6YT79_DANRE|nr:meprin A subunit beta isoform X2 [Danio rerio]|eukprot:XP_017206637.2 meprin A subunit beta isoform X2 [Danio rerio]